jgi:hypothetical protein
MLCARFRNGRSQRFDIAEIAMNEMRRIQAIRHQPPDKCLRGLVGDIDKRHLGALPAEMFDQAFTNAAAAPAHKNTAPLEAGITRRLINSAMHGEACFQRRAMIFMPWRCPCQVTAAHGAAASTQLHIDFVRQQNTLQIRKGMSSHEHRSEERQLSQRLDSAGVQ